MSNLPKIATLIRKYLADDLTPTERDELREWLDQAPRNREIFDRLLEREELLRAESTHTRFARYMDLEASKTEGSPQSAGKFRHAVRRGWYSAAAAAVLCGLLPTEFLPGGRPDTVPETPAAIRHHTSALLIRGNEQPISISDTTATLPHGLQMTRNERSQQTTLHHSPAGHDTDLAAEEATSTMNRLIIPRGSVKEFYDDLYREAFDATIRGRKLSGWEKFFQKSLVAQMRTATNGTVSGIAISDSDAAVLRLNEALAFNLDESGLVKRYAKHIREALEQIGSCPVQPYNFGYEPSEFRRSVEIKSLSEITPYNLELANRVKNLLKSRAATAHSADRAHYKALLYSLEQDPGMSKLSL